jgi:hypothetical protein
LVAQTIGFIRLFGVWAWLKRLCLFKCGALQLDNNNECTF